jgi:hypothetical protein
LSNNTTFQDIAFHGTHAAKSAAQKSVKEVKNSEIYKTAAQTVQEKVNTVKQSESFKQMSDSEAGKFLNTFVQNVKKEWKANPNNSRIR